MKFNRRHQRFTVYHLDYILGYYKEIEYKLVDISKGGFSISGDLRGLSTDKVFKRFTLSLGLIDFEVTAELVYFGAEMSCFKIKSFNSNDKSVFHKFLDYMQIGYQEDHGAKPSRIDITENEWKLKTPKISIMCNPDGLSILKKPFLSSKSLTYFCTLGFISGLNRKFFPIKQLSLDLIKSVG